MIDRRALIVAGAATLLAGLTGCPSPSSNSAPASTPNPSGGSTPTAGGAGLRVALVLDVGGIDDKSFNQGAWNGLQKAQKELALADAKYVELKSPSDYKTNLTTFATQGYDIVIAVGFAMADALKEVAPQFPNVKFAIIDSDAPAGTTNVVGLTFKAEEGSFLAGYLAAATSKTKKIGFVGGMQIPLIETFEAGYRAGAKTAGFDPKTQVLTTYTGDWNDLTKGKSQAQQEFANGADIIFQAAGKSGLGVIEAAKEKGKGYYAIGVDRDQDNEAPGRVLTSMVKHVDNAVFDTVRRVKENQFKAGTTVYDLKMGGVGLSEMKFTKQDIAPAVLKNLTTLSDLITAGKINIPTKVAGVDTFQPPKL